MRFNSSSRAPPSPASPLLSESSSSTVFAACATVAVATVAAVMLPSLLLAGCTCVLVEVVVAVAVVLAVAVVVFIWGLIQMIGGGEGGLIGEDRDKGVAERRAKGKRHMVWGLLGIFIMIGVYGILAILLNTFGIEVQCLFQGNCPSI